MALWTVDGIERKDYQLAEDVQSISPIFKFSNHPQRKSSTTPQSTTTGERVRSLTYEEHSHVSMYLTFKLIIDNYSCNNECACIY